MTPQEMQSYLESRIEVHNNHDLVALAEYFAETAVWHYPGTEFSGWSQIRDFYAYVFRVLPDYRLTVDDLVAVDNKMAWRWHATATHTESTEGETPTGKSVNITGITLERLEQGKQIEAWIEYDRLGMRQQLGLIPD